MTRLIRWGITIVLAGACLGGAALAVELEELRLGDLSWHFTGKDGVAAGSGEEKGISYLSITVPETVPPEWPRYIHVLRNPVPGSLIAFEARVCSPVTRNGAGAYVTVEFLDAENKRIAVQQSEMSANVSDWRHAEVLAVVPDGAVEGHLCLVFNGTGEGRFTSPRLEITPPEATAPDADTIRIAISPTPSGHLLGLGFEDDGWFYNQDNREKGVEPSDWTIREERIAWMEPDLVRMFFWYRDWNPSGDWKTFDFESDNMRSHYQSLEIYQRLGCPVIVTGVEWGTQDPYGDPEACAAAIGALLEHLVRSRGFTCIRYWALSNEPNGYFVRTGYDFERYKILHRLVAAQIRERDLSIGIVGSDDAMGPAWFRKCAEDSDYYTLCEIMASHFYVQYSGGNRVLRHYLDHRLSVLATRAPVKPFAVTEFGFQDHRSTVNLNPLMDTYDYALWTMEFALDGLNRGVRGFSIWCLQDVWYPRLFMGYGLWRFKEENWRPKPVYYAWSTLTRLTKAGDPVFPCDTTPAGAIRASCVAGRVLFWVNPTSRTYTVELPDVGTIVAMSVQPPGTAQAGAPAEQTTAHIFEETQLEGDRYAGRAETVENGRFQAPPRSFGYVTLDTDRKN